MPEHLCVMSLCKSEDPKSPVMEEIDRAYDDLDRLLARQHAQGVSPELEREIDAAWARLDESQAKARIEVQQQLDASVELPTSKLEELVRKVKNELGIPEE